MGEYSLNHLEVFHLNHLLILHHQNLHLHHLLVVQEKEMEYFLIPLFLHRHLLLLKKLN